MQYFAVTALSWCAVTAERDLNHLIAAGEAANDVLVLTLVASDQFLATSATYHDSLTTALSEVAVGTNV